MTVAINDNHLTATQSWDKASFQFYPESETTFFSVDNGYTIKFNSDSNQQVESITINGSFVIKKVKD